MGKIAKAKKFRHLKSKRGLQQHRIANKKVIRKRPLSSHAAIRMNKMHRDKKAKAKELKRMTVRPLSCSALPSLPEWYSPESWALDTSAPCHYSTPLPHTIAPYHSWAPYRYSLHPMTPSHRSVPLLPRPPPPPLAIPLPLLFPSRGGGGGGLSL